MRIAVCLCAVVVLSASGIADEPKKEATKGDAAFAKALAYLAKTQKPDGSWDTAHPRERNLLVPGSPRRDHFTAIDTRISAASLAGLCFIGEGSTLTKGTYASHLQKAYGYIVKSIEDADFGKSNHGAFSVPFISAFLAELLLHPDMLTEEQKPVVRKALEKTTKALISGQKLWDEMGDAKGSWGYGLVEHMVKIPEKARRRKEPAAATALMGLLIARDAGIDVPANNIDMALAYVKSCAIPQRGDFAYQSKTQAPNGYGGYARTAGALYDILRKGETDSEIFKSGLKWLKANKPMKDMEGHQGTFVPWAYFFGALLMNQMDEAERASYMASRAEELAGSQQGDGSWFIKSAWGPIVYSTGLEALAIAIPRGTIEVFKPKK